VDYKKLMLDLAEARDECLGIELDPDGAVILSHAIAWANAKLKGVPYRPPTD
jgi:hypothetical protein